MCVCIHICIYTCISYIHIYVRIYICTYTCIHVYIYMYAEQWWCGARARAHQHDPLSIYSTYTYIYKGAAASSRPALYRDSIYTCIHI